MSGPKGYGFTAVPSAAELARRELVAVQGRCAALSARLRLAELEAAALGGQEHGGALAAPARQELPTWQRHEDRLTRRLADVEEALLSGRRKAWAEQMAATTSGLVRELLLELTGPGRRQRASAAAPARGSDAERSVASAVEVAASVKEDRLRVALLNRAEAVAAQIGVSDAASLRGSVRLLQSDVQAALRQQRRAEQLAARRDALALAFAEVESADAGRLAEIQQADESECDRLDHEHRRLSREAAATADRAYVIAQATEVLRELGYAVDTETERAVLDGEAVLALADQGRALRLQMLGQHQQLLTNAVAVDATDDRVIEERFCSEQADLRRRLAERGVSLAFVHHVPVGRVPVERLDAGSAATPRARVRRVPGAGEQAR